MIVWTDIETTGLDERTGKILEIALVVTDDDLNEITYKEVVIRDDRVADLMDPYVLQMHTKNGLLSHAEGSSDKAEYARDVERRLIEWLFLSPVLRGGLVQPLIKSVNDYRTVPLAGSTVGFDRRWLRHHMPRLEGMFSHRSIDVSSITELAKRWAPAVYEERPKSDEKHRALSDVRGSIEVLRYYWKAGFIREAPKMRMTFGLEADSVTITPTAVPASGACMCPQEVKDGKPYAGDNFCPLHAQQPAIS